MKVVRANRDQLILDETPWVVGGIFIAIILVLVGSALNRAFTSDTEAAIWLSGTAVFMFLFFCIFTVRTQVIFDRRKGHVILRRRDLRRMTQVMVELRLVQRAVVETDSSDGTDVHRVALVLAAPDEQVPLTTAYSNFNHSHEVTDAINAWLKGDPTSGAVP